MNQTAGANSAVTIHRTAIFFAATLLLFLGERTSERLISRRGVSGLALGELGWQTIGLLGEAHIDGAGESR